MSSEVLDRLEAAVDDLASLEWDRLPDDAVLEVLRRVETAKRRLAPVDHAGRWSRRSSRWWPPPRLTG